MSPLITLAVDAQIILNKPLCIGTIHIIPHSLLMIRSSRYTWIASVEVALSTNIAVELYVRGDQLTYTSEVAKGLEE